MYKDEVITSKIVYCDGLFRKGSGLMFRSRDAIKDTAWLFRFKRPRTVGVTMWFVLFPIDLIFFDKKNTVIELKENLRPFAYYNTKKKIYSFVELESGMIRRYHLKIGQTMSFRR
jgi:uncharacterized membrane protein (UPF0127 family)